MYAFETSACPCARADRLTLGDEVLRRSFGVALRRGHTTDCYATRRRVEGHPLRMRPELQPVHIYMTPDAAPIRPDWLAVVRARTWSRRRPEPEDAFVLSLLR